MGVELIVLGLLAAGVAVAGAAIASSRWTPGLLAAAPAPGPALELSDPVTSGDVDMVRLGTAAWGYSLAEVDEALAARRRHLAAQERALSEAEEGAPSVPQAHAMNDPRPPELDDSHGFEVDGSHEGEFRDSHEPQMDYAAERGRSERTRDVHPDA